MKDGTKRRRDNISELERTIEKKLDCPPTGIMHLRDFDDNGYY